MDATWHKSGTAPAKIMYPAVICDRPNVRFGSRLFENSDAELARRKFVSITLNNKRTALTVTVEIRKERKQFCAFSARGRFNTAWVNHVDSTMSVLCPLSPR